MLSIVLTLIRYMLIARMLEHKRLPVILFKKNCIAEGEGLILCYD